MSNAKRMREMQQEINKLQEENKRLESQLFQYRKRDRPMAGDNINIKKKTKLGGVNLEEKDKGSRGPPVQEGDSIEVEVINIGKKGDGIARYDDFVIVVPEGKPGQKLEVEITRVLPRLAFSKITREI